MPASRAASSSTNVPKTSVWMNASGSSIERSTCDSAAKLTTASQPSIARATASRSAMSASTNSTLPGRSPGQVLAAPRVGELVEDDDPVVRMLGEAAAHIGRADEPGPSGNEKFHRAFSSLSSR